MEFVRLKLVSLAALGLALSLSGCQSGDTLGALKPGGSGLGQESQGTISATELLGYCPAITLGAENAVLNSYQRGGDGDPAKLIYRAGITETTRSCSYGGGMTSMSIGLAGRVIPGPVGHTGSVRLPIRIKVYQDSTEIHSHRIEHDVAITDTAGATQYMLVDNNFSMPNPTSRNVRVIVSFDEPAKR